MARKPRPNPLENFRTPPEAPPEPVQQRDSAHVLVGTPRPLADTFLASGEPAPSTPPTNNPRRTQALSLLTSLLSPGKNLKPAAALAAAAALLSSEHSTTEQRAVALAYLDDVMADRVLIDPAERVRALGLVLKYG